MLVDLGVLMSCEEEILPPAADIIFEEGVVITPTLTAEQGTSIVKFSSARAWTAEVEDTKTWCAISPASGAPGLETILTITVDKNETYKERSAVINIISEGVEHPIKVTQSQKDLFTFTGVPKEVLPVTESEFEIGRASCRERVLRLV